MGELLSAATGIEFSKQELQDIAFRQLNTEKALNIRLHNFEREDDLPTPRDQNEPLRKGNLDCWKMDMVSITKCRMSITICTAGIVRRRIRRGRRCSDTALIKLRMIWSD